MPLAALCRADTTASIYHQVKELVIKQFQSNPGDLLVLQIQEVDQLVLLVKNQSIRGVLLVIQQKSIN